MNMKRVVGYFNGYVSEQEVAERIDGYTDVLFSFWVSPELGVSGAAEAVVRNASIMQTVKEKGKKCILAAGGGTYVPQIQDLDSAKQFGSQLAEYALQHEFDGVDFDIENFPIGSVPALEWLATATNAFVAKTGSVDLQISHAPQAPYFLAQNGYAELEKSTNGKINFYNIQYYNQGTSGYLGYDTFTKVFNENFGGEPNATSIESITKQGVPAEKLLVGKPIAVEDANNGYIPIEQLEAVFIQAQSSKAPFGGTMGWAIDSDPNGVWGEGIAKVLNA